MAVGDPVMRRASCAARRLARGDPGTAEGGRRRPPSDATSSRSALLRGASSRGLARRGLLRRGLARRGLLGCRLARGRLAASRGLLGRRLAAAAVFLRRRLASGRLLRGRLARGRLAASRGLLGRRLASRGLLGCGLARRRLLRAAVFFAAVLRAAGFLAAVFLAAAMLPPFGAFAQFRTPCASGVGVPVRSSRPRRRSAHRGGVRSSDIRCARDTRCRSAWPPSMSLPSRGRKPLGRTRDTVLVLAKGCSDARFVSPRNHIRVILREEHPR